MNPLLERAKALQQKEKEEARIQEAAHAIERAKQCFGEDAMEGLEQQSDGRLLIKETPWVIGLGRCDMFYMSHKDRSPYSNDTRWSTQPIGSLTRLWDVYETLKDREEVPF